MARFWRRAIVWRFIVGLVGLALVVAAVAGGSFVRGLVVGIFGAVVTVGSLIALLARKARKGLEERLKPPPLPTGRWDRVMEATDLEGTPVSFADHAGKVLVLNFWATWCAPCVAEMPSLERLREATADLDVVFAYVTREKVDVVRAFLEKRSWTLPVLILDGEAPERFRTRSIPATFVVDRSGFVALRHTGAAAWDDETVVTFVRGLAATPVDP